MISVVLFGHSCVFFSLSSLIYSYYSSTTRSTSHSHFVVHTYVATHANTAPPIAAAATAAAATAAAAAAQGTMLAEE